MKIFVFEVKQTTEIVRFYQGFLTPSCRHLISDIWELWPTLKFEEEHDFIQWIFPLDEPSSYNSKAPILTKEDIQEFRKDHCLQHNVMISVHVFMRFLYITSEFWCTDRDHNHLRITRILKSLVLLGLEKEAGNVFDELIQIVKTYGMEDKMSVPISFWRNALRIEGPEPEMKEQTKWYKKRNTNY